MLSSHEMNPFKILATFEAISDRRMLQLEKEEHFDKIDSKIIEEKCGTKLSLDIVLARSQLNRDMSRAIKTASLSNRSAVYKEYIDKIDTFDDKIQNTLINVIHCDCSSLEKVISRNNT
jgi:CRISPR/Cas system CSM-associated protein Csm2 small subunit